MDMNDTQERRISLLAMSAGQRLLLALLAAAVLWGLVAWALGART
jgi:hypothetical protein